MNLEISEFFKKIARGGITDPEKIKKRLKKS